MIIENVFDSPISSDKIKVLINNSDLGTNYFLLFIGNEIYREMVRQKVLTSAHCWLTP